MKNLGFNFDTTYTTLPQQFFTKLKPDAVASPDIVIVNEALATSMGLDFSDLTLQEQANLFSGNHLPEGATPFSQAYAGHQFGHFTLLGDGRAHIWGEHVTPAGNRLDIQFKGSGRTPYSRHGDGRAALGPILREYILSEGMHRLRIPTTRALAVVTTGEPVMRDKILPGAILTRVANSCIRIGTFEFAARQSGRKAIEAIMDYTIRRHDPDLIQCDHKALAFLDAVIKRQIDLVVHWMRVGFIHGVMNTDNTTLSGETMDYGPCAFMDAYDPMTVFSSIDQMSRYAYANQPEIAQWNLARFAETLLPFIDHDINQAISQAEEKIDQFPERCQRQWLMMMASKLGLFELRQGDEALVSDLLKWMQKNHADYTNTFRDLSRSDQPTAELYAQKPFQAWYARWQARLKQTAKPLESSLCLMRKHNPAIIPRNHNVEKALEAGYEGNFEPFRQLLAALEEPYQDRASFKCYQNPPQPNERVYQTFCGT